MVNKAKPAYWTFAEVKSYLGYKTDQSVYVWLSRAGITPIRHYRINDVVEKREGK